MTQEALVVTLDGPRRGEGDGVLAEDFARVLTAVSKAMRLMVGHLGGRSPRPGRWPAWVEEQSRLKLAPTRSGSFVAELTHDVSPDTWRINDDYGERAFAALKNWDGEEDLSLPKQVTDCLYDTASRLSKGTTLWFGDSTRPRRVRVMRVSESPAAYAETLDAILHGWLKAVNWQRRTAQLHDYGGGYVRLRFDRALDDEMRRLATQYVEVRGRGELNEQDQWTVVRVEELLETRSDSEPFDLDAFLRTPNPKRFVPARMVTASVPFDVDGFNRAIREARDL